MTCINCPKIMLISNPPIDERKYYYVFPEYVNALRKAGASVIIVTPGEKANCVKSIYELCDGVMLTGGGDIDPALYGGNINSNNVYGVNNDRDNTELLLAKIAITGTKPLLGICRGMQMINIVLGGNLYEDISQDSILHRTSQTKSSQHCVKVSANSTLLKQGSEDIISWHHQAVKNLANGLTAVAISDDNIVEAFEMKSHPWLLGVQWHPEMSCSYDITQEQIFQQFVDACRVKQLVAEA